MIIGIDLDEVLAETVESLLEQNNYYIGGRKLYFEDITDYYIYNIEGVKLSIDEAIDVFRKTLYSDIEKLEIKPVKGVYNKLKEWKEKGYKLKVITARPGDLFEKYTLDWLDKHYLNIFDEVYFANNGKHISDDGVDNTKKSIICQNLGVDVMIEDNPEYAKEVADCGIKTYLIKKPWNKNFKETKNMVRVKSWDEINI